MTEREAWIIFAGSYGAREECSAIACAEFADLMLKKLEARFPGGWHTWGGPKQATEAPTARYKRLAAKKAREAERLNGVK